jgi:hypothetical protein
MAERVIGQIARRLFGIGEPLVGVCDAAAIRYYWTLRTLSLIGLWGWVSIWQRYLAARTRAARCEVYWGSHGCRLGRGHDGPHLCECAVENWREYPDGYSDADGVLNVGAPPYYGAETNFYGDDAKTLGLRGHSRA